MQPKIIWKMLSKCMQFSVIWTLLEKLEIILELLRHSESMDLGYEAEDEYEDEKELTWEEVLGTWRILQLQLSAPGQPEKHGHRGQDNKDK